MESTLIIILVLLVIVSIFGKRTTYQNGRTEYLADGTWNLRTPQNKLVEVVGESYRNSDGVSRQQVIQKLRIGDNINLIPEPNNPHSESGKCVAVWCKFGQIGYLPEYDEDSELIFDRLIENKGVSAVVLDILGGIKDKPHFGVWLDVDI